MSYRDWRRKEAEPLRAYYDFVDNEKEPEEKDLTRRIKTYTLKFPRQGGQGRERFMLVNFS
jgi:hypothetical protein